MGGLTSSDYFRSATEEKNDPHTNSDGIALHHVQDVGQACELYPAGLEYADSGTGKKKGRLCCAKSRE